MTRRMSSQPPERAPSGDERQDRDYAAPEAPTASEAQQMAADLYERAADLHERAARLHIQHAEEAEREGRPREAARARDVAAAERERGRRARRRAAEESPADRDAATS